MDHKRILITGGSGFIGSHFIERLLKDEQVEVITIYDEVDYRDCFEDNRLIFRPAGDPQYLPRILGEHGYDLVIHLAANGDIARAETEPALDFMNSTLVTHHVLEGMRINGIKRLLFMSSGGVYGVPTKACHEDDALRPIAPYAANKVASEALIRAYGHMFGIKYWICRPANVVGKWMTRGVTYDLVKRLSEDPAKLTVRGNGWQSKSYVLAEDVVDACLLALASDVDTFNVAFDYLSVREIVNVVLKTMGLTSTAVTYGSDDGGWKGDVPVSHFDTGRIQSLGWKPSVVSAEAVRITALAAMEALGVTV